MMHGATFSGNLFFDPLATNLGSGTGSSTAEAKGSAHEQADPSGPSRKRGMQTPAEHKALRAASLSKLSRDLERMLRERKR